MAAYLTRAERDLIVAVIRWCRANGWETRPWNRLPQCAPDGRRVDLHHMTTSLVPDRLLIEVTTLTRELRGEALLSFTPASVVQAVDVLTALGLFPAEFSSAYDAGRQDFAADMLELAEADMRAEHPQPGDPAVPLPAGVVNGMLPRATCPRCADWNWRNEDGPDTDSPECVGGHLAEGTAVGARCPSCGQDEQAHLRADGDGRVRFGCPVSAEAGETEGPGFIPDGGTN